MEEFRQHRGRLTGTTGFQNKLEERRRYAVRVSERREETSGDTSSSVSPEEQSANGADQSDSRDPRWRLSKRGWTIVLSGVLVVVFTLLGTLVRIPYVALGPGPTYDTLGAVDEAQVVSIEGHETYSTEGELRMTTVALNDDLTLFGALGLWISGRYAVAPREHYFEPGQSEEEVEQENVRQFQHSQSDAEVAALRRLGFPVRVVVDTVVADSAVDDVLSPGDELLRVGDRQVDTEDDVHEALEDTSPGDSVSITFLPDEGAERTETVTLTEHPDRPQGFAGFAPVDRADVPFDVDIALEDVGGPSAGLMFALAIVDRMTPEDLVGGERIAGTGEISDDGEVGPIGGISFKVTAAGEDGASAFLVPEGNCAEAEAAAPDDLDLIKVSDLDEAVDALKSLDAGEDTPSC